jgi:hypothetical protein
VFDSRRREFITLLGGAVVWPVTAVAQQRIPVIGFVSSITPEELAGRHRHAGQFSRDIGCKSGDHDNSDRLLRRE